MKRRSLSLLLALSLLISSRPVSAGEDNLSPNQLKHIEQYVAAQLRDAKVPGASLVIVRGDQVVYAEAFGVSSLATGRPATVDTGFAIGSVTKTMTATAILQLYERGMIDLDAPVQRYLPWWRLQDEAASAQITIRHLLQHTSGIPANTHGLVWRDYDRLAQAPKEAARELVSVAPIAAPGTKFEYANMGYLTLGLVVEAVSGQPFETYIEQHIFGPLGMTRSAAWTALMTERADIADAYAWSFLSLTEAEQPRSRDWMAAAGSTPISTAQDMTRYLSAQLGAGPVQLLRPETRALAQERGFPTSGQQSYNLGWMVDLQYGTPLVYHSGGTAGSTTFLGLLPEQDIGFMLMVGAQSIGPILGQEIARMLLGQEPAPGLTDGSRLNDMIATGLAALGLLLLLWLGFAVRRRRRPAGRLWLAVQAAICLLLTLGVAAVGLFAFKAMAMPSPMGFYGYPVNVLTGVGLSLLAFLGWTLFKLWQLIADGRAGTVRLGR